MEAKILLKNNPKLCKSNFNTVNMLGLGLFPQIILMEEHTE